MQDLVRGDGPLAGGLHGGVIDDVARRGFAHVRAAMPEHQRRCLLDEAGVAGSRFLTVPDKVNGVQQRADQLTVRIGDPDHPSVNLLSEAVRGALRSWPAASGAARFSPSEARYMRYTGSRAGLGAHLDGKCYRLLVFVFSLAGSACFTVLADGPEPGGELLVEPGDLLILRAPGFRGAADGRRRHAVGPPLDHERISLTLRMVGGPAARPECWARPA